MDAELQNAAKVIDHPQRPLTAIVGGAKVSDKIELISNLIDKCDHILIGGGMAYTFFAAQGYQVGNSICETDKLDLAKELLEKAKEKSIRHSTGFDRRESFMTPGSYTDMGLDIGLNKTILIQHNFEWPNGRFIMTVAEATKKVCFHLLEETNMADDEVILRFEIIRLEGGCCDPE
jgi:3-phosphoglycerate kinase